MVILETAAVGAAGYGAYLGGEISVRKTKQAQKEVVREKKRYSQRNELANKNKERSNRIARLTNLRNGSGGGSTSTSTESIMSSGRSSSVSSSAATSDDVNERHKAVMEKLGKNKPKSSSTAGSKFTNLFKRNKK